MNYPLYTIGERTGALIQNILKLEPGAVVKLKKDKRFKQGNIKQSGNELRGDVEEITTISRRLI